MRHTQLPVAVIGAGPVGLAAAAHLASRGIEPVVLEAGPRVAASVRAWGHVRLFSPWEYNVDPVARRLLEAGGWKAPDAASHPTGDELVARYLEPLARLPAIAAAIRLETEVITISRRGASKLTTADRTDAPFALALRTPRGRERLLARAVIDASGTWQTPNPLGADGVPALDEELWRIRVHYGIPDVLGHDRPRYAGHRVLVVGSGHSAANAVLDLVELRAQVPTTRVTWLHRKARLDGTRGRDQLAARGALDAAADRLVTSGDIEVIAGFSIERVSRTDDGVLVHDGGRTAGPFDIIIGATGFRPDLSLARELRLDLDNIVESPRALAPLIDPNVHSCGTVPPHGAIELAHESEPGFFVVGMKSYGRAPTFLMRTGYEQVRSVVAWLAGDRAAAREVSLVLPATGACSTAANRCC